MQPPRRIRRLIRCLPLLLTAAACVPGDGPQPPVRTILAGAVGRGGAAGMSAPPSGAAGMAPPGAAGMVELPAGRGGVTAGMGVPPAGRGGAGSGPVAGTAGQPVPPPDGGMTEFDAGSEPTRNTVRVGQLCERFTTIQCAGEAYCCSNPGRDNAKCRQEMLNDCNKNAVMDDIAKNEVAGFSPTHAEAFFAKMEEYASKCDPTVGQWIIGPAGLVSIFQGSVAPMGQCRPSGFSSLANYGAALASCTSSATHACLFSGNGPIAAPESATCAPRADVGATCFVGTNCKDGLYCNNPTEKYSAGKCAAFKAVGASCSKVDECLTQTCVSGRCAEPTVDTAWCF